ncbi:MAG: cobyrinate a,c-diamide synthase [Firmicutes bacterium]|nr:cobyrinate a,c-diamide synthase [Bacillota bacterium]
MSRVMLAATSSGSGKTSITCALLKVILNRGLSVKSFKCGPDYVDAMLHKSITGVEAGNLDGFFNDKNAIRQRLAESNADINVVEGVMGYYDGIAFSDKYSSYDIAIQTNTPVILVLDCKGMLNSLGAVLKGFVTYRENSGIAGIIFNRLPANLYDVVSYIALDLGVVPLGYLPNLDEGLFESKDIGLVTPDNISEFHERVDELAENIERYIDVDRIINIAQAAGEIEFEKNEVEKSFSLDIAVAHDKAFCFNYGDNLALLEKMGCNIKFFSPLEDSELPDCDGLIINDGYPEVYAEELSENTTMLKSINKAIKEGLPTIATGNGFSYLHEELESTDGNYFKMVGFIKDKAFNMHRLHSHCGYITAKATKDNLLCKAGETFNSNESHYYDSDNCGEDFEANVPVSNKKWKTGTATATLYAGYPVIYFPGAPKMAENFLKTCNRYKAKKNK